MLKFSVIPGLNFSDASPEELDKRLTGLETALLSDLTAEIDKRWGILLDSAHEDSLEWDKFDFARIIGRHIITGILAGSKDISQEIQKTYDEFLVRRYSSPVVSIAIQPQDIQNTAATTAIAERTLKISGDFSADQIDDVKKALSMSINRDRRGKLIPREALEENLQEILQISKARAKTIAQTEITSAYNIGRVETALASPMVTHIRFIAIQDTRTTEICKSRHLMLIPVSDRATIAANTPALHPRCRSVVSPVMAGLNPTHKVWASDPALDYKKRVLVPLGKGWNSDLVSPGVASPKVTLSAIDAVLALPALEDITLDSLLRRGKEVTDILLDSEEYKKIVKDWTEIRRVLDAEEDSQEKIEKRFRVDADFFKASDDLFAPFREAVMSVPGNNAEIKRKLKKIPVNNRVEYSTELYESTYVEFSRMVRGSFNLKSVKISTGFTGTSREYVDSFGNMQIFNTTAKRSMYHEFGHMFEDSDYKFGKAARDFLYARATGGPVKLSELNPGFGYEDDEVALPDKFINDYVGRLYNDGSTEVWSSGLERMIDNAALSSFYSRDKDHFYLTLGGIFR
jgi:SPP1 gp7 family putative phage head morphogenesis protein